MVNAAWVDAENGAEIRVRPLHAALVATAAIAAFVSMDGTRWAWRSLTDRSEHSSLPERAETAAARPLPGAHSIWELVVHMTAWLEIPRRRIAERQAIEAAPEEDWPPCPAATEVNWRKATQELTKLNQELRQAVHAFPEARLDEPLASGVPYTAYTQFIGVTQHNLYHAGQIAILKRAVRTA